MDIQQKALQCVLQDNSRQKQMTTYIWCTDCNQLYNKEIGCELCAKYKDVNETTKAAIQEAKDM